MQTGVDPTVTAILSLVGVMIGAGLAGAVRYVLDKRAERAHFRAAVWMLLDDLARMRLILDRDVGPVGALGVKRSQLEHDPRLRDWLHSEAWDSQRQTLARGLLGHEQVWDSLRWTLLTAAVVRRLYAEPVNDPMGIVSLHDMHDALAGRIAATLSALQSFASGQPPQRRRRRDRDELVPGTCPEVIRGRLAKDGRAEPFDRRPVVEGVIPSDEPCQPGLRPPGRPA